MGRLPIAVGLVAALLAATGLVAPGAGGSSTATAPALRCGPVSTNVIPPGRLRAPRVIIGPVELVGLRAARRATLVRRPTGPTPIRIAFRAPWRRPVRIRVRRCGDGRTAGFLTSPTAPAGLPGGRTAVLPPAPGASGIVYPLELGLPADGRYRVEARVGRGRWWSAVVRAAGPPCGGLGAPPPPGAGLAARQVALDRLDRAAGFPVARPHSRLADDSLLAHAWVVRAAEGRRVTLTYRTGITIVEWHNLRRPSARPPADAGAAGMAAAIVPARRSGGCRDGSLSFTRDGVAIGVYGHRPPSDLVRIARSVATGSGDD
jgi:hypothetical protein